MNVRIVALSSDDVEHAQKVWEEKVDRKFTVLSDPGAKVAAQFGLLHAKGHEGEDIAIRTSVLLDENGVELWRRVSSNVMETPSVNEILDRIRGK